MTGRASTQGDAELLAAIESELGAAASLVGQRVGRFELLEALGRGGQSHVYRARPADGRPDVALKIPRATGSDALALQRFRSEGEVLRRVQHPGVVRFVEAGDTEDGRPYLVMELVDGEDLSVWLDAPRTAAEIRRVFTRIAWALAALHRAEIVHRDVKPTNVVLDSSSTPVLVDLGIARDLGDESSPTLTGLSPMTPAFASPEQREGQPATKRSDIYSVGVMLGLAVARLGHQDGDTRRLAAVVHRATAFRPEQRYPSAEALAAALRRTRSAFGVSRFAALPVAAMLAAVLWAVTAPWEVERSRRVDVAPIETHTTAPEREVVRRMLRQGNMTRPGGSHEAVAAAASGLRGGATTLTRPQRWWFATAAKHSGNYDAAIEHLRALAEDSEARPVERESAAIMLANAYVEAGRYGDATRVAEAIVAQPAVLGSVYRVHLLLGGLRRIEGAFDRAWRHTQLAEESLAGGPEQPWSRAALSRERAQIALAQGQLGSAVEFAKLALEQHYMRGGTPQSVSTAHSFLGRTLAENGQCARALAQADEALRLAVDDVGLFHPHAALAHDTAARALLCAGDPLGALTRLDEARAAVEGHYGDNHPWHADADRMADCARRELGWSDRDVVCPRSPFSPRADARAPIQPRTSLQGRNSLQGDPLPRAVAVHDRFGAHGAAGSREVAALLHRSHHRAGRP